MGDKKGMATSPSRTDRQMRSGSAGEPLPPTALLNLLLHDAPARRVSLEDPPPVARG
ncbi:hypothetical protein [Streptomyces sp. NBC_00354]|uniref:hypothetical protein n=1 Tax=Streptomyces sp. NBC_00354 TaxID=2975723 RepID=UPI002E273126